MLLTSRPVASLETVAQSGSPPWSPPPRSAVLCTPESSSSCVAECATLPADSIQMNFRPHLFCLRSVVLIYCSDLVSLIFCSNLLVWYVVLVRCSNLSVWSVGTICCSDLLIWSVGKFHYSDLLVWSVPSSKYCFFLFFSFLKTKISATLGD